MPDTPTLLRYMDLLLHTTFSKARTSLSIGEQLCSTKAGRKIFAIAFLMVSIDLGYQVVFNNTSIDVSAQTYRLYNLLEAVSLQIQLV